MITWHITFMEHFQTYILQRKGHCTCVKLNPEQTYSGRVMTGIAMFSRLYTVCMYMCPTWKWVVAWGLREMGSAWKGGKGGPGPPERGKDKQSNKVRDNMEG
jgi:hypothetical protein